jgi:hypothetical protein
MTIAYRRSKDGVEISVDGVTLSGTWDAMSDFVAALYRSEQSVAELDFKGCDKG